MKERITKGGIKKSCSKCGYDLEEERIGKYRYCLACHAAYMREHRPKHSDLPEEQKRRANARSYLNEYLRRGKVEKKPCSVCGSSKKLEAHHEDYLKPLEVVWYCRKHHLKQHYGESEKTK